MYTYIVQRTQIYLTEAEARVLDRRAKTTGRTRSQLIREAIEAHYRTDVGREAVLDALRETAGAWQDHEAGAVAVERLRDGRLARLLGLDPDRPDEPTGPAAPAGPAGPTRPTGPAADAGLDPSAGA